MARKKYIVSLSSEEREDLEHLTTAGKVAAYKMNHARILLKADTNQEEVDGRMRQLAKRLTSAWQRLNG